ncbi:MAG: hypothetical protein GX971_04755 [Firmicutes bacterium]|nr:hypothetical protein [Bacillota bacterium]
MKKAILAVVILLLGVGGVFIWQFVQKDPADVARAFLEQVVNQEFVGVSDYFSEEPHPSDAELSYAFRQLSQAFALSEINLTNFDLLSKGNKEAVFAFELDYLSSDFESVQVQSSLNLKREGYFDEWKIEWRDNLPLPTSGLAATYTRVRLEPQRGEIVDSKGQILAGAGSLVTVGVQPDRISDPDRLLDALQTELGLNPEHVTSQYSAPGVQGHWFVPLTTLSEAEYTRVDPILRPIPGVFFRRIDARSYPQGSIFGHLTGYLGEVTSEMLQAYPERDYVSGEIVGRAGLESSRDDVLRGRPGYRFSVMEGTASTLLREKPVIPGANVELTIDSYMQELAYEILGDRTGALVVLNAETGEILALASTPSYDPNEFIGGISARRWQELSSDPDRPMFNRALQGLYPPGSVFKVVTVAAALDQDLYEPSSPFVDSGQLTVQGNIIRNFQGQVFGEHDLHQALVDSVNTTIAQVGLELGASRLEEYFTRFKLNEAYRLGLPMSSGQVGSPARSRVALAWSAIGQDQVLLTPLHLAQVFSVFANDGYLPPIHLVKGEELGDAHAVLQTETVDLVNVMLQDVVQHGTGTQAQVPGLTIYGKTGTAETVGSGTHAWFAGHTQLPTGEKIAFALLVEEGGVGGQTAAPLVRNYLSRLF